MACCKDRPKDRTCLVMTPDKRPLADFGDGDASFSVSIGAHAKHAA